MLRLPKEELSYWCEGAEKPVYPQLLDDIETDVAIIGAGITGLSCAYLLKQAGYKVAVLEKRTVGAGTTGRTTGKVTSQHSLMYKDMTDRLGKDTVSKYGAANQSAVDRIEEIIRKEGIDCDWRREDNYVFTADPTRVAEFKGEAEAAAAAGLPAEFVTESTLPFPIQGAVRFTGQATFHAQKYLAGLAASVNGEGSYVFENSRVIGIRDGSPGRVRASEGNVTARHIIVATNVPTLPLMARGGYCVLEYPTESYIIAVKASVFPKGMYISPDSDHYSILPVRSEEGDLLLIGGGGHLSGLRLSKDKRFRKLADYAEKHFGATEVLYKWSDRDYIAYDRLPLIGKLYPWSKNLYVGTAYRKWGLTGGTVAGMVLSDMISGRQNTWAEVFTPQRIRPVLSIPGEVRRYLS
jgi:glycine/D-amino acid oxidase-like deaminating enzyme